MTSDDIVAVARLGTRVRGESLKTFGIQGSCVIYMYEEPVNTLEELLTEVRKCLGEDWNLLDDIETEVKLLELMDKPLVRKKYGTGPID